MDEYHYKLELCKQCNYRIILILGSGRIDGAEHNVSDSSGRGNRYCEATDRIVGAAVPNLGVTGILLLLHPTCIDHYTRTVSEWTKDNRPTVSFGLRGMTRRFRDCLGR